MDERKTGKVATLLVAATLLATAQAMDTQAEAARNARQASEAVERSRRAMHAWLRRASKVTGLLPRTGKDPNWVVKDSAADLYPFLVLAAYFAEPSLYETTMREILRQEVLRTTRVSRLSDDLLPGGGWAFPQPDLDRIIFGSSEYAKDGLLPITELLGETPWYHRLRGIAADIVRHAPYRCSRGRLPACSAEINGNMLQVLARLAWKTGEQALLEQALAIADFYFFDMLPATNYIPVDLWDIEAGKPQRPIFVLSDHGNEIVGGLSEVYWLALHRHPDKARRYREPFTHMIDRLLEKGRNADGVWVSRINVETGEVADARHAHCWGYMFNAVYTAFLATGEEKYRRAVESALRAVTLKPEYLFDEKGAGRGWGANAYSDSIEGALVLLNRVPNAETADAVDAAMRKYFDRQRPDGIIEDWYGDGNYIRTSLMYALWKSQGVYLRPWTSSVQVGAVRSDGGLTIRLEADAPWQGRLCFDHPRHRDHWNIARNYPRLNEFPEWFTVEHDAAYQVNDRKYLGAELIEGIPQTLAAGQRVTLEVRSLGAPPYGNK